ncbi:hypothetical protein V2J09_015198 [Rumex salicifolius]
MSTIEKLFVQIFDRKRQIIQQLNHQKELYDQNLASKLLIQGITPPPWLLNSDKFASYSASSSDPKDLNKEELISGLLLPCPQPVPSYCNATHLYGKPLSTVGNGELQHDLFNATDAGGKGLDDCRFGVSPQRLIKDLEDGHHHVAESPQERVASDIYADLDQSLARMQRSKSRQKAFELRSGRKVSIKCHLEDNPPTGPRRQDAFDEFATTSGGVLSTSKDICLLKKQDISSKEEGVFRFTADETDAPTNMLSPHSHCQDMSVEEPLVAANNISGKEGMSLHLHKESIGGLDESCDRKCANADLFKDELMKSQCVYREVDICTSKSKCDNTQKTADAERLVAIELSENTIDQSESLEQFRRSASLGVPPSYLHASHESDRKMNVFHSAPVEGLKQTILSDTSALSVITGQLLVGDFERNAMGTDAPTNLLSPHSDCRNLPVEVSLVAADSVSCKGGVSASAGVLEQTNLRFTPVQSDITGQTLEGDFRCTALQIDAPRNLLSPNSNCRKLSVEESLVAEDSVSSKGGISRLVFKESVDMNEICDRNCANSDLLTEDLRENQDLSKEEDISLCHTKELEASSDLLSPEKLIAQPELDQPNSPSSETVIHVTNSSGKHKAQGETAAEGALVDNLLHMVKREELRLSSAELTSELDLENCGGLCSGKNSRESQRRYEASTDQCITAEWSGETVNELATSNSEDSMKHASVRQKPKPDDAHSRAVELQATCFSKEDKISMSPKLLELQTLSTESSPTFSAGGSWPRQKRRKIESIISKSASPHLRVNSSSIFSPGIYVAKSFTGDFSATKIFQNGTSSLGILPEHSSVMQHKEEKLGSQGRSDGDPEKLEVYSVPCLTQQLTATPQECLNKDDRSMEKCDVSCSISKGDGDPADSKIWRGENSLEHEEAVGAEGDRPDLECFTFDKKLQNAHGDDDMDLDYKVDDNVADILGSSPTAQCQQKVNDFLYLGDSPLEHRDTVGRKTSVTDLVNFTFYSKCNDTHDTGDPEKVVAIDLPKNTIDRAEFLERLCRSASLGVSFAHLHASYSFEMKEDVRHSVPAGVLEQPLLSNTSPVNDGTGQLLKAGHTCTQNVENSEFQGKSFSDLSPPTHGTPFSWDFKGPYMSPFEKAIEGVTAKSRSSSNGCSSNPELTCFPIEESGEEDVSADDSDHNCPEETGSIRKSSCTASEEYMNVVALDPASEMVSLGSVSTETSISTSNKQGSSSPEITCIPEEESSVQHMNVVAPQAFQETSGSARKPLCDISKRGTESFRRTSNRSEVNRKISQNSEVQPHQSGRLRKRKVTQNISLGTTGKNFEPRPTRFSKPKVSVKPGLETRGGSLSVKEANPSNIVSSIKSFLPLVQQKQAASCAPVKKEVRVKALEAAEAAKRLAEKKENERNQKKEALKLERARVEQEKVRQLELLKKAKEEERKRKEAEIAERKRKREEEEEEERKEKEKKRKRVGEARKQKKGHEDKLPVEKQECNLQAEDGKRDKRREDDVGTEEMVAGGLQVDRVAKNSASTKEFSATVAGCSTPTPDVTTQTIREKSYDISPYCCSDEEDEEEELSNNKFIPAWASKSSIKTALASLDTLDAEVIFPPSSFRSLNEGLLSLTHLEFFILKEQRYLMAFSK